MEEFVRALISHAYEVALELDLRSAIVELYNLILVTRLVVLVVSVLVQTRLRKHLCVASPLPA